MESVDGGTEEKDEKPKGNSWEVHQEPVLDDATASPHLIDAESNSGTEHAAIEGAVFVTGIGSTDNDESNNSPITVMSDHERDIATEESVEQDGENRPGLDIAQLTSAPISDERNAQPDSDRNTEDSTLSAETFKEEDDADVDNGIVNEELLPVSETSQISDKEVANKDISEKDADEEVDEFFRSVQAQPAKTFPGLDNVDLTSDDEGQEGVGSKAEENVDSPEHVKDEETGHDVLRTVIVDGGDDTIGQGSESLLKKYPINIGNYKVCRQVEPGVKECIVLETGEHVKCISNPKDVLVRCEPVSTSSPRIDGFAQIENDTSETQLSTVTINSVNMSEQLSFPDDSASTIIAADPSLVGDVRLDHQQKVFITKNGIPVIMDNAEDDLKIGLQAEIDRVGKAIKDLRKSGSDAAIASNEAMKNADELVGDVLSSGGDGEGGISHQRDSTYKSVKKSKGKRDSQRYYVLQPDRADGDDDKMSESDFQDLNSKEVSQGGDNNRNNNNKDVTSSEIRTEGTTERLGDGRVDRDVNNSAYSHRYRLTDSPGADVARSNNSRSPYSHGSGYYDDISWLRDRGRDMSQRQSPTVLRGSSLNDNSRYLSSQLSSGSYSRYADQASLEASRISTRYSRLDRGQHNVSSPPGNKETSWHDMFKMIEEQHRSQQQQQYMEHQRILQEMQESMKLELNKQQDTLKDRLNKYNEMLEELSLGRQDLGQEASPSPSSQEDLYRDTSNTTLEGMPISLKYPPPLIDKGHRHVDDRDRFEENFYDQTPVKRSLEKELRSPPRPADMSLNSSQASSLSGEKQLRGGVYSSPMPLAKAKHKTSSKGSKSYDTGIHLSPRENAPHHSPLANSSYNASTLATENAELRQRCQDLEDACHDRKIEIRELTQKIQGLERKATDCMERFETSQSQVLSLHNRLEELTEYAKERDGAAAGMEVKAKKSSESLQSAHKREKELTDSLQAAKITIRKLVEKYEMIEKDHDLLKESYKDQDESLSALRKELRDACNKMSRLELENKQLTHEKDILKHELTMARNSPTRTNFEDALESLGGRQRSPNRRRHDMTSPNRAYRSVSRERSKPHQEWSPDYEVANSKQSPIIRAERELQKLRESMVNGDEFAPKLQRKFYGTDVTQSSRPSVSSTGRPLSKHAYSPQTRKSSSSRDNKGSRSTRDLRNSHGAPTSSGRRPEMERDLDVDHVELVSDKQYKAGVWNSTNENGLSISGDQAIERVKKGEIISRPAWEDVHTSMATGSTSLPAEKKRGGDMSNSMRDLSLRERLQNIEHLERKYDDLSAEKKKYESALSRVRGQSQRREKDRLESELDRLDRELGSVRMSLKRFHVLKSSI